MPAIAPYIPPKDAEFDDWLANFSALVTATPGAYGLVTADAVAIASITTAYGDALTTSTDPSTRTPVTVQAKNTAKTNALAVARPYAQNIANNAGVDTSDKIALGLNPRTNTPSPISAPTTAPIVGLIAATFLVSQLSYRDEAASPTSKAKPYGALQLELRAQASTTALTDPEAIAFRGIFTKSPLLIEWDAGDRGKPAYICGRWLTRRGLVGPWSNILNTVVV